MKLIIKTVYENVDYHWLSWWIETMGPGYGIRSIKDLPCSFENNDPTSEVTGKTEFELITTKLKPIEV